MTCPNCGADLELVRAKDGGCIEEPVIRRDMSIGRVVRPATFWACMTCDHCEEVSRERPPTPAAALPGKAVH